MTVRLAPPGVDAAHSYVCDGCGAAVHGGDSPPDGWTERTRDTGHPHPTRAGTVHEFDHRCPACERPDTEADA